MSDPTTTPVDKSAEPPIRDEIRRLNASIDGLQRTIGPLFDAMAERLLHRLSVDREADTRRLDDLFAQERVDRDRAIAAAESRANDNVTAAMATVTAEFDSRFNGLELRIGKAMANRDSVDEEIAGTINVTIQRVDALHKDHEETRSQVQRLAAWVEENKGKLGVGVGGTGLGLALASSAPHWGDWLSAAWKWIVQ